MNKYFKAHPKLRNGLLIICVILAIPISYLLGGYHLVDSWLSSQVRAQTNSMIQNHYINSVKRSVTPNDVTNVERKINFIYDSTLKKQLKQDTNAILNQAELQSSLLEKTNQDYQADDLSDISLRAVKSRLNRAQDVLNPQVRTEILRKGNTVLDRSIRTKKAVSAVNQLFKQQTYERADLSKYYTALALTDLAYGKKVKSDLHTKLNLIYDKLNQKLSQTEKAKQKAVKQAIAGLKSNHFTGGNSTITTNKLTTTEMTAFKQLDDQTGLYLNLNNEQLTGYQLSHSKTDIDKALQDDATITSDAKKVLTNHDATNPIKVDHQTIQFNSDHQIIYLTADTDLDKDNAIIVGQDTINQINDIIKSTKAIIHLERD